MDSQLRNWIRKQLNKGYSQSQIIELMVKNGYKRSNAVSYVKIVAQRVSSTEAVQNTESYQNKQDRMPDLDLDRDKLLAGAGVLAVLLLISAVFLTGLLGGEKRRFEKLSSLSDSSTYSASYQVEDQSGPGTVRYVQIGKKGLERRVSVLVSEPGSIAGMENNTYTFYSTSQSEFSSLCTETGCSSRNVKTTLLTSLLTSPFSFRDQVNNIGSYYGGESEINGRSCHLYRFNVSKKHIYDEFKLSSSLTAQQQDQKYNVEACIDSEKGFYSKVSVEDPANQETLTLSMVKYENNVDTDIALPYKAVVEENCRQVENEDQIYSFGFETEISNITITPADNYGSAEVVSGETTKSVDLGAEYEEVFVDLSESSSDQVSVTVDGETISKECPSRDTIA